MAEMIYRRFGRTELQMPVFSCGGMRYQHKWQDVPDDQIPRDSQANLEATIRRALELGINHIETARGYGSSERQLGHILPNYPRRKLIVQTKIGPSADADQFVANFRDSLARLKLDHVDLLAIHGINDYETLHWSIKPGGCLAAARKLQREGLANHIGFSTHGSTSVIQDAIRHEGDGGFDYVNLHWYYIYQKNWAAVEDATQRDMGVFIISPTDKGGKLYEPPQKLVDLCRPLHPIVFNDLFCLARPEVHTLSVGAARPSDFDEHIESLQYVNRIAETIAPIERRLEEAMAQAVGADFAKRFDEGLPEWSNTPGYVNLQLILWLRNLAVAYDLVEYGKMRYNLLGNASHWFPGNNASVLDSYDVSKAIEKSPFADQLPELLQEAQELLGGESVKRLSQSS